jgi:TonB-dependent SusC/RagA subfamily outer membrane receptor
MVSQAVVGQGDTLTGVLRNAKDRAVRNYPVALGREAPVVVKTDARGVFRFVGVDLNDTLFVDLPGEDRTVVVAVNGYNYITVKLTGTDFEAERRLEPDAGLKKILSREREKMVSSTTMGREEIEKSRCLDIPCLLKRMSGVFVSGSTVRVRGIGSVNSSNDALVVLNGIPMNDNSILSSFPVRDVEEISVLKEGSQYGARGANGVIIIRTSRQ